MEAAFILIVMIDLLYYADRKIVSDKFKLPISKLAMWKELKEICFHNRAFLFEKNFIK